MSTRKAVQTSMTFPVIGTIEVENYAGQKLVSAEVAAARLGIDPYKLALLLGGFYDEKKAQQNLRMKWFIGAKEIAWLNATALEVWLKNWATEIIGMEMVLFALSENAINFLKKNRGWQQPAKAKDEGLLFFIHPKGFVSMATAKAA